MSKVKNIQVVGGLKEKLVKAKSLVLTDYRGLTHKQLEELHRKVKPAGGEYLVVKNALLKIAAKETNQDNLSQNTVTGPLAALIAFEDELAPLRELVKFVKNYSFPTLKFGYIGSVQYDAGQIDAVSKLPGKQELQAQVVNRLSGPIYGLVGTLNGNLQKLVYILGQVRDKGGENHV